MRMGKEAVVLGYQVFVPRERGRDAPISKRYSVRSAAEQFAELAIREGHVGVYVHEVTGFEKQKAK